MVGSEAGRPISPHVGTPAHYGWLEGIVRAVLVLNLLDAVFTLFWVHFGLAHEANPLLDHLVVRHPIQFVATKLALVGLGSFLLWNRRHRPIAVIAIFVAFLVYYALLLVHLRYMGAIASAVRT
ncbi:MAG TPA: DUF5658 family protein [Candidatus Binatia bacterium]|nr:DUF5658 family protein [Candidatus Binatia bacterium]